MSDFRQGWQEVSRTFEQIWGYKSFRPPQDQIIRCLLEGKDALIVMPTGGGKSICFQLPALLQRGTTLIVSPLVALMENQVRELKQRRLPAALLHSELPRQDRQQTLQVLKNGQLRLLYLSPETLLSRPVWSVLLLPGLKINGIILDEAHCLVQWGETFRPAYRRLGAVRPTLLKQKPKGEKIAIAAFTATADPLAQSKITQTLQLKNPQRFLQSPYRPNLNLSVQRVWTPRGRRHRVLRFIEARSKQSGLIYVRSRRESEALAAWLGSSQRTAAYHAGLSAGERRKIEADWFSNQIRFVVCTCAFGMGVNKADVRWILHYSAPLLLSEYLQEIGRGGRDAQPAEALTLISEPTGWLDPSDRQRHQFFIDKLQKQYQQAAKIARKLPPQGEVQTIAKQFPNGEIALAILHSAGQLEWQDPFHYRKLEKKIGASRHQASSVKQMTQYLNTRQCRWQFLLAAFGFQKEARRLRCGHCDNCKKYKKTRVKSASLNY